MHNLDLFRIPVFITMTTHRMNQTLNLLWNLFSCNITFKAVFRISHEPFFCVFDFFTDPHIKVSGKKEDVKEAKEMIMSVLDTKVSE